MAEPELIIEVSPVAYRRRVWLLSRLTVLAVCFQMLVMGGVIGFQFFGSGDMDIAGVAGISILFMMFIGGALVLNVAFYIGRARFQITRITCMEETLLIEGLDKDEPFARRGLISEIKLDLRRPPGRHYNKVVLRTDIDGLLLQQHVIPDVWTSGKIKELFRRLKTLKGESLTMDEKILSGS